MNNRKYIAIPLIAFALSAMAFTQSDELFRLSKNMGLFADLYKELNKSYVDEIQPDQLMKDGLTAMLKGLDPYTNYISDAVVENAKLERFASGGDIGAELMEKDGNFVFKTILEGNPAAEAGLKPGDILTKIDRKSVKGKNLNDIIQALRGAPDSPLQIDYIPFGEKEEQVEILYRAEIKPKDVTFHQMLNDTVGYVRLETFMARGCGKFVENGIKELKDEGAKYLVYDLRDNGGGLLNEAINICNLFSEKGKEIVTSKGRFEQYNKSYVTQADPTVPDMPLIVLINGKSASASEIVSGTMQDLDRGVLVGELSYGKGLVQQTQDISFGGKLKLTIAKYFLPTGRCIQAVDYYGEYTDGAKEIADSLKNAFTTPNGRTVYDNSGVMPDVEVKKQQLSAFTQALVNDNVIFDYVNTFQSKNDSIVAPLEFDFTENDYTNFVKFVQSDDFNFESQTEKTLADLKESLKEEKVSQAILADIAEIENMLAQEKVNLLNENSAEIRELIKYEIIERYHFAKGKITASLNDDPVILKSFELFNDMDKFYGILGI